MLCLLSTVYCLLAVANSRSAFSIFFGICIMVHHILIISCRDTPLTSQKRVCLRSLNQHLQYLNLIPFDTGHTLLELRYHGNDEKSTKKTISMEKEITKNQRLGGKLKCSYFTGSACLKGTFQAFFKTLIILNKKKNIKIPHLSTTISHIFFTHNLHQDVGVVSVARRRRKWTL